MLNILTAREGKKIIEQKCFFFFFWFRYNLGYKGYIINLHLWCEYFFFHSVFIMFFFVILINITSRSPLLHVLLVKIADIKKGKDGGLLVVYMVVYNSFIHF